MTHNSAYLNITSEFSDLPPIDVPEVDFSKAEKLDNPSETYETYLFSCNNRRFFIKRLKNDFKKKPFYRKALEKEFEIGSSLHHKGLPTYREIGEGYIAMDFIDGLTLSQMVKDKDPWLNSKSNIRRMMLQLVETVGYLHSHHIRHCDIKPDNIMITKEGHNVVLLDLDKCHSDWLNNTSGDPEIYLVEKEKTGSNEIDFHGIGMCVDFLMNHIPAINKKFYRKVRKLCFAPQTTVEKIYSQLLSDKNSFKYQIPIVGSILLLIFLTALLLIKSRDTKINTSHTLTEITSDSLISHEIRDKEQFSQENTQNLSSANQIENNPEQKINPIHDKSIEFTPIDEAVSNGTMKQSNLIDTKITEHFSELGAYFLVVDAIKQSDSAIPQDKINSYIDKINNLFATITKETTSDIKKEYTELSEDSLLLLITKSPEYKRFKNKTRETLQFLENLKKSPL